jgi:3-oxoacyl-(acyl-carrier-protein) synthase
MSNKFSALPSQLHTQKESAPEEESAPFTYLKYVGITALGAHFAQALGRRGTNFILTARCETAASSIGHRSADHGPQQH